MQLPMVGSWTVDIVQAKPFTIHGDMYHELHITRPEEPGQVLAVKVPHHACKAEPIAGQKCVLTFLMGQITEVRAAE